VRSVRRDELAETPGADDEHAIAAIDRDLRLDRERRRERLGENGGLIAHSIGQGVKVRDRKDEVLGERTVQAADAEHPAALAVIAASGAALAARAAADVDLADDAAADPLRCPPARRRRGQRTHDRARL
jgi:hypothetical protein